MSIKLSSLLKDKQRPVSVAQTIREYEDRYWQAKRPELEGGQGDFQKFANLYYDLVTDFYEYGWGRSFHFAPRDAGENFNESLSRHEHRLAQTLGLGAGMVTADLGCGIGGPAMEIARFSGARIVGVNNNAYQVERARALTKQAGLNDQVEYVHEDYLHVDAPDNSFDAAYAIESTCYAPDKVSVYGEIFRLLKPGASFAAYEYCLTDRFDANNAQHLKIKADVELGGGMLYIDDRQTVDDAIHTVGFELMETRDLAVQTGPSIPWYQPLDRPSLSSDNFRSSTFGRSITHSSLRALEALRVVPQGMVRVSEILNFCAVAFVESGRLGIITPMYFFHARKPA